MRVGLTLASLMLPLQASALATLPTQRLWLAASMLLAYAVLCARVWYRHRHTSNQRLLTTANLLQGRNSDRPLLVAYASQTGQAEQLALQSAQALHQAGLAVRLLPLGEVTAAQLQGSHHALFVASTTGEGAPPDNAMAFVRRVMGSTLNLAQLQYGVLALGDRDYQLFCGFGQELDGWLRGQGATPLFQALEAHQCDGQTLADWSHQLAEHFQANTTLELEQQPWQSLQLAARQCLNPGSLGLPSFQIGLGGASLASLSWASGDILEVMPRQEPARVAQYLQQLPWPDSLILDRGPTRRSLREWLSCSEWPELDPPPASPQALVDALKPLARREYSIASLPTEGRLDLLVRQTRGADGSLGLGSGWLTEWLQPGEAVEVRVRRNPGFHLPTADIPLIFIGNGTGMAGLRAHLKARVDAGHRRNWLLFGERQAAHDFYFADDIQEWQAQGFIERLDLAFSRDENGGYVQDRLRDAAPVLRRWLADGAAIYVCGSLEGMAAGVDGVLRDITGDDALDQLIAERRYCRDVY